MTSNKDFCHDYAYSSKEESRKNGNMSYYNGVMLSYNIAIAKKFDNFTLFNQTRYSNTTSKQQSYLINALSGKIIYLDGLRQGTHFEKSEIISGLTSCYKYSVENLANAKRANTKEKFTAEIYQHQKTLNELLEYKILTKKDLTSELKALLKGNFDVEKLVKIKKAQVKKEERARLQRLEQQRQDFLVEILDFRAGNKNNISYGARDLICGGFDIIRLEGEEILTSQNIRVPLKDALTMFKLANIAKDHGVKNDWMKIKESDYRIAGKFKIDNIDASGDCFVGCHKFRFEEILRCYKEEYKGGK